jgi:hypothetical protein
VSEVTFVETHRQHAGVGITQSFDACITTIKVETVVGLSIDVIKRGKIIGYVAKLGSGLGGILVRRNLS